jgi:hypothetical protein
VLFDLPASDGFLLAVGAALLAQLLTLRPTQDLDYADLVVMPTCRWIACGVRECA